MQRTTDKASDNCAGIKEVKAAGLHLFCLLDKCPRNNLK